MPIYLEVMPSSAPPLPTARQPLAGDQCMVFYLGGTPTARSPHTGGILIGMADGSVRTAKDLDEIAAQLSRTPLSGGMIILGLAGQVGYATTRWQLSPGSRHLPALGLTSSGGNAVLIGLLLPAVQAAREAARTKARSAAMQQLKSLVGPSGHVFVIGSQGELLAL